VEQIAKEIYFFYDRFVTFQDENYNRESKILKIKKNKDAW